MKAEETSQVRVADEIWERLQQFLKRVEEGTGENKIKEVLR